MLLKVMASVISQKTTQLVRSHGYVRAGEPLELQLVVFCTFRTKLPEFGEELPLCWPNITICNDLVTRSDAQCRMYSCRHIRRTPARYPMPRRLDVALLRLLVEGSRGGGVPSGSFSGAEPRFHRLVVLP